MVLRLALPPSLQGTHLSLPPWLQCQHQAGITCSRGGPTHFCASIRAAISFHSSAQPVLLSGLQVGQVTPPPTPPRLEPAGSARKTRPNPHALFPLGSTWSCQSLSTHPPGCPVPAGVPTPTLGSWTGREVSINSEGEVCVFGDRGVGSGFGDRKSEIKQWQQELGDGAPRGPNQLGSPEVPPESWGRTSGPRTDEKTDAEAAPAPRDPPRGAVTSKPCLLPPTGPGTPGQEEGAEPGLGISLEGAGDHTWPQFPPPPPKCVFITSLPPQVLPENPSFTKFGHVISCSEPSPVLAENPNSPASPASSHPPASHLPPQGLCTFCSFCLRCSSLHVP